MHLDRQERKECPKFRHFGRAAGGSTLMNEWPKLGRTRTALNVHDWVDVVMSGAGTDRPRQSLLLVGALR